MDLKHKFFKFIGAGAVNTAASYALYAFLVLFINYQIAYAVAFVFGIVLSFLLNTKYVFQVQQTMKKFLLFPLVYVVQYVLGAVMMNIIVEIVQVNKFFAPLIVTVALLPISYVLSKKILVKSDIRRE